MPVDPSQRYSTIARASSHRPLSAPLGPRTRSNRTSTLGNISSTSSSTTSPPTSSQALPATGFESTAIYLPEFGLLPNTSASEERELPPVPLEDQELGAHSIHKPEEHIVPSTVSNAEARRPEAAYPLFLRSAPASAPPEPPLLSSLKTTPIPLKDYESVARYGRLEKHRPPERNEPIEEVPKHDPAKELPVAKTPGSVTLSLPSTAQAPSQTPSPSTTRTLASLPKLATAPPITFDSDPVPWKGLTMDAALCKLAR